MGGQRVLQVRPRKRPPGRRRARQISADKYLRPAELAKLKDYFKAQPATYSSETTALIVNIGLCAGLRREEIADLIMRDLPHNRRSLSILVRHGKGNVEREVEITANLSAMIETYCRTWRKKARIASPLFKSRLGGHMSPCQIWRRVRAVALASGVKVWPHKLRHTYCTYVYNEIRDLRYCQNQLGHSTAVITEAYTGLLEADREMQLEKLNAHLLMQNCIQI
jgi:integrase